MDMTLPVWVTATLPRRVPRQSFESICISWDVPLVPLNVRITPEVSGVDIQLYTAHSPELEN